MIRDSLIGSEARYPNIPKYHVSLSPFDWDDLTHFIALTIDRSDWIISEISRGKRPYSSVPFLNGELFLTKISTMS